MADLTAYMDSWESLQAEKAELIVKIGQLEMHMRNAMTAEEATYWDNEGWVVELKQAVLWDEQKLAGLGEFFNRNDLADLKNSVKLPTFNKTKLRTAIKRGGEVARIINEAQSLGAPEVKIRKKEER